MNSGIIILLGAVLLPIGTMAQSVVFVRSEASGNETGTTWADAYSDLQTALQQAPAGSEVWVAAGRYQPGNTRSSTFMLRDGLTVIGGFSGVEHPITFDLLNHDPRVHASVLDGNIGGTTLADNVYHVVTADGVDESCILDGFTISGGYADGLTALRRDVGGGMIVVDGHPTIRRCLFLDNQAGTRGGAVHVWNGSPRFDRCTFLGNRSVVTQGSMNTGGAVYCGAPVGGFASPTFISTLFAGNGAGVGSGGTGGALYAGPGGFPSLVNCTVLANRADTNTGGVQGGATLTNCVLWGNRDAAGSHRLAQASQVISLTYSCIQGGWNGTGNTGDDPMFVDPVGEDGVAGTADDDLRLLGGSPCLDAGDNDALPPDAIHDLAGDWRVVNDPATPDRGHPPSALALVDLGAYEFQASCARDSDCDDGVPCTIESCDLTASRCTGTSIACDDGLYCNGPETCVGGQCVPGLDPCPDSYCDESSRSCVACQIDADCSDGLACTGVESCAGGTCASGLPVSCDDGIACTTDLCVEPGGTCESTPDDSLCNDRVFCNGPERCDTGSGCVPGTPACGSAFCDEGSSTCRQCLNHDHCDDGFYCNGQETCDAGVCATAIPPCAAPAACDEFLDACVVAPGCSVDGDCPNDGNPCTNEICQSGSCVHESNASPCDDANPCTQGDQCTLGACAGVPVPNCPPGGETGSGGTVPPNDPQQESGEEESNSAGDADLDGVLDEVDRCPQTPLDSPVNEWGCAAADPSADATGDEPRPVRILPRAEKKPDGDENGQGGGRPCISTGTGISGGDDGCVDDSIGDPATGRGAVGSPCGACGSLGMIGVILWPGLLLTLGRMERSRTCPRRTNA